MSTGLPIGRILALQGTLEDRVLATVLEIQVRLRDGAITREDALIATKIAGQPEESLTTEEKIRLGTALQATTQGWVRLGELLVMASLIDERDVLTCLEVSLETDQFIGQVMFNQGYIDEYSLTRALELQKMAGDRQIEPLEASRLLQGERFDPN
jgi:hypothetical protein